MRGDLTPEALLEHQDFMRALAKRLLFGDEHKADDVVQQAWLAALKRPPRDRTKLRSWLGKVVRNFALRRRRDDARRARLEHGAPPREPAPSSAEILERENTRRRVVLAVLDLDEPYRSAVVLRYLEELKPREVARRLGVPVETVRTRLKRALEQLRGRLDAAHGGDRRAWGLALVPFALPTGSAVAAGAVAGAVTMGTKTKLGIAAAVLVVCALLAWTRTSADGDGARGVERRSGRGGVAAAPAPADTRPEPADAPEVHADEPPPPGSGSIRGRVVADGRPLAGAYVELERDGEHVEEVWGTGADGTFRFDRTGAYTVRASHPGRGPARAAVTAAADEVREVVLELPPALAVEVHVVDGQTGAPVEGAEVFLLRSGTDGTNKAFHRIVQQTLLSGGTFGDIARRMSAYDNFIEALQVMSGETDLYVPPRTTDAEGRARLGGLLPGPFEATVRHPEYTPALARARAVDPARPIEVTLGRGTSLTVVAPRYGGRPAVGYVCELARAGRLPMPVAQARLDETGRVTFGRLRAGAYVASVSPDGLWHANVTVEKDTDESGQPIETRKMSVTRAQTGDVLERTVSIERGKDNLLDFSAIVGATVRGRVLGAAGPWAVRLLADERIQATGGTAEDASFAFTKVPPGRYRVVATPVGGGGEVEAECAVRAGDAEVEVELRAATGVVAGLVTDAGGRPLPEAALFLLERTTPFGSHADPRSLDDLVSVVLAKGESGPDGMYRMDGVPAGDYLLFCGKARHLAQVEFPLGDGESRRVDVRLAPSDLHRLTVRLTDGAGGAVAGHVVVRDARAGFLAALVCDPDALDPTRAPATEYAFQLSPGRYLLDVYAEGRAPQRAVPMHLLGDRDLELPLTVGVPVRLRLVRNGEALADRLVSVRFAGGATLPPLNRPFEVLLSEGRWRTDATGTLVLPHVAPGNYKVALEGEKPAEFRVRGQPVERTLRVGE